MGFHVDASLILQLALSILGALYCLYALPWKLISRNVAQWSFQDVASFVLVICLLVAQLLIIADTSFFIHVVLYVENGKNSPWDFRGNRIYSPVFEYGVFPTMGIAACFIIIRVLHKGRKLLGIIGERQPDSNTSTHSFTFSNSDSSDAFFGRTSYLILTASCIIMFTLEVFFMVIADAIPMGQTGQIVRLLFLYMATLIPATYGGIAETKILHHSLETIGLSDNQPSEKIESPAGPKPLKMDHNKLFAAFLKEKITKYERIKYYLYTLMATVPAIITLVLCTVGEFHSDPYVRTCYYYMAMSLSTMGVIMGMHQTWFLFDCIQRVKKSPIHISPTKMQEAKLKDRSSITPSEANYLVHKNTMITLDRDGIMSNTIMTGITTQQLTR